MKTHLAQHESGPTGRPLPAIIVAEVVRQQTAMGWPDMVPTWAYLPNASGIDIVYRYEDLTVALCEQLVKRHSRVARSILKRRGWTLSDGKVVSDGEVEDAARHILMARLYRCRYISLVGQQDSTEDDMPFAHNRW